MIKVRFKSLKSTTAQLAPLTKYQIADDFESITPHMVKIFRFGEFHFLRFTLSQICRHLINCGNHFAHPSMLSPTFHALGASGNVIQSIKDVLALRVEVYSSTHVEDITADVNSAVLFQCNHGLLNAGYLAFATDSQLRGVVARWVDAGHLEAVALRSLTFGSESAHYSTQYPVTSSYDNFPWQFCRWWEPHRRDLSLQGQSTHACCGGGVSEQRRSTGMRPEVAVAVHPSWRTPAVVCLRSAEHVLYHVHTHYAHAYACLC